MTKTRVELNPEPNARSSLPGHDGQDQAGGDASSRHHVTSKHPQVSARTKSPKEISSKKPKRAAAGQEKGKAEMKAVSKNRSSSSKSSERRKTSEGSITSDDQSKDSGCVSEKLSTTDSSNSSEVSDAAEEIKLTQRSHTGARNEMMIVVMEPSEQRVEPCAGLSPKFGFGEGSISPGDQRSYASLDNMSSSAVLSELTGDFTEGVHEDLLREIIELRSENEYLKDEMEEIRSEMLEMRDLYMEEDVYQLQELRQQLEQANKACRILQYRLRKAERRSLRVAQTGQVDGELIRTLEHDIRVAKSVSLRLHSELEAVQKKNSQLQWENEELRERQQDLEVAKQVLQAEMDKSLNSLKRRSYRSTSNKSEKKLSTPDDSADLICQLHFAKEESALMCKKLTKMALESEAMREQITKYRLLYGEVDESQAAAGTKTSTHTREAEAKVHLRLVEEEATLLSRRIVELEVENRGLRAEMSELRERGSFEEEEPMKAANEELTLPPPNREQKILRENCKEKAEDEHSSFSQMHREGPIGGEQELSVENKEEDGQVEIKKSDCLFGQQDLEGLVAIHEQAQLVISTLQFLTVPPKYGFSSTSSNQINPSAAYLNKTVVESLSRAQLLLDPMLSPLTSGLEVLQAQLCAFIEKIELIVKLPSEQQKNLSNFDGLRDKKEVTKSQIRPECDSEEGFVNISDEESLILLTFQLRYFLQQWREGERLVGEPKNLFENDLQLLKNTDRKYKLEDKCNTGMKSVLLSDLRTAIQDLFSEILEQQSATQCFIHQFANAKAAWAVECAELKSLVSRLEGPGGKPGPKKSPDQKEHVEKLQQLLAESYAAVLELSRQLKVRESSWISERKELLQQLHHVQLESEGGKKAEQNECLPLSVDDKLMAKGGSIKRITLKTCMNKPNKNWAYLSHEAACVDREDACKTWDCPIMPSSFPYLHCEPMRSHTAPERSSIRIYYSPPSAKKMNTLLARDKEKREDNLQTNFNPTSCGPVNQDWHIAYENWLSSLSFDCQSLMERDSMTMIRSTSSSALQNSSSQLAFKSIDASLNLSDDMKEITASVLQSSHSVLLERKRTKVSGGDVVNFVTTGTQTQPRPQMNTIGLQTDGARCLYAAKNWSPRAPSIVSSKIQQASSERLSGTAEAFQPRPNSPKMQRRVSTSSLRISSSSSSFTSPSLSSSSSLSTSSRLNYGVKEQSLWPSTPNRQNSSSAQTTDKSATRKNAGVHKYGLVHEFLRNVCGRGEKSSIEVDKAPVTRKEHNSVEGQKKPEHPPSRIPAATVVRNDSITKIVNRRFMKHNQKEEIVSQNQNQTLRQNDKVSVGRNKSLELGADESSSRSLTSCFARASQKQQRHGHGQNKGRLYECSAVRGKADPLI